MATMWIDGKNSGDYFCGYCGGNAGQLNEGGVHNLCAAQRRAARPTPSLGLKCCHCNGTGFDPNRGIQEGQSLYNPSGRALAAAFPPCATCDGTGALDEKTYYGLLAELQEIMESR